MLDAIKAFHGGEYRIAILYSAIAMETLAGVRLEAEYNRLKASSASQSDMRFLSFRQAGGMVIVKDPIYDYISDRDDFAQLLHIRPLYLLKRSLLDENENLYRDALELYRTRNKIAHRGTGESNCLSLDETGATKAIKTAIQVLSWFGEKAYYHIDNMTFVPLGQPSMSAPEEEPR